MKDTDNWSVVMEMLLAVRPRTSEVDRVIRFMIDKSKHGLAGEFCPSCGNFNDFRGVG